MFVWYILYCSIQGPHEGQYGAKYEIESMMQLPPNSLQIVQQAQQATAAVGSSANYGYAPQGGGGQQYPNQNAVYGGGYGQQQPKHASHAPDQ